MLKTVLLIIFIFVVITVVISVIVGLFMGFGAMFASIGTAIYHIFKKEKVDKSKNKNFKIDQGRDI